MSSAAASRSATRSPSLGDPSLDLVYWLPERETLVLPDGSAFQGEGSIRLTTRREDGTGSWSGRSSDPSLADEPGSSSTRSRRRQLWLENGQLQAELRAQFVFLETIVNTAPSR